MRPGRKSKTERCCPQCGYDVRELTEPRCPECGINLEQAGFIALPIDTWVVTISFFKWMMGLSFTIVLGLVLFGALSTVPDHYMPYTNFQRSKSYLVYWDDYRFHFDWVEEDRGWHVPGNLPVSKIRRISIKAPHIYEEFGNLSGYTSKPKSSYLNNLYIDIERNEYWISRNAPPTSGTNYGWPLEPSTQTGKLVNNKTAEQYFTTFLGNNATNPRDIKAQKSFCTILDQIITGATPYEITNPELRLDRMRRSDWYAKRHHISVRAVIAGSPVLLCILFLIGRLIYAVRRNRLNPKFCAKITS